MLYYWVKLGIVMEYHLVLPKHSLMQEGPIVNVISHYTSLVYSHAISILAEIKSSLLTGFNPPLYLMYWPSFPTKERQESLHSCLHCGPQLIQIRMLVLIMMMMIPQLHLWIYFCIVFHCFLCCLSSIITLILLLWISKEFYFAKVQNINIFVELPMKSQNSAQTGATAGGNTDSN